MIIEINGESFYEKLRKPASHPRDVFFLETIKQMRESEGWKAGAEKEEAPIRISDFGSETALPFPFTSALLFYKRNQDMYSLTLRIKAPDMSSLALKGINLKDASEKLGKIYEEGWISTNPNSFSGYFSGFGECRVAVLHDPSERELYQVLDITIGAGGAIKRKFTTLEEFCEDTRELGEFVTNLVGSGIELAVDKGLSKSVPDIKIELS